MPPMKRFSRLYDELDQTTKTNAKVAAMVAYFQDVPPEDAAWAVFFLTGQRLKRLISGRVLRDWALNASGLPEWLVVDAYAAVGDSAETVSLLLDQAAAATACASEDRPLHDWMENRILPLRGEPAEAQEATVRDWWTSLPRHDVYLLNKLLTGGFRVGVSKLLVVRALAEVADLPRPTISHRLMGQWQPTSAWYQSLLAEHGDGDDRSRPYPFFLASALEQEPAELGPLVDWQAEWKWDGIRGQLIRREGDIFLWTRGEELVTERYPEIAIMAERLPDGVVLDGEILAWDENGVMPFSVLQTRIGRDKVGKSILAKAPVGFLAYDLMEQDGQDLRQTPLTERRVRLQALVEIVGRPLMISEVIESVGWAGLASIRDEARSRRVEGLMLKRAASPYRTGRQRGDWWKWKLDPLTIDAVLIYAQAGSGRRANLFTDYTFAVWQGDELVPIGKAYSGLSDKEITTLDRWIRKNTKERFGPVRHVLPHHVFELAFEGVSEAPRRKAKVSLRFPRIARWRSDKTPADADKLDQIESLLKI